MKIQGRIIFYNPQSGRGTIILHTKKKVNFSIENWDEFETAPKVNLLVDCGFEKETLTSITLSSDDNTQQEEYEPEQVEDHIPNEIKVSTYTVDEALKLYFNPIMNVIGEPPSVINTKEQLDYFLSKRFLFTAYNNLRNLDPKIYENNNMKSKITTIEKLDKAYHSLIEQIDIPQYSFEMIFLRIQPEYIRNQEKEKDI